MKILQVLEQVEILKDDVATVLNYSDYHLVAEALGAQGFILEKEKDIELPRKWNDYKVTIQREKLPKGIILEEKL